MKETLDAIYENGVLRPLSKLSFPNGRRLRITLETESDDTGDATADLENTSLDVAHLAGSLKDSPRFSSDPVTIQRKLRDEWS